MLIMSNIFIENYSKIKQNFSFKHKNASFKLIFLAATFIEYRQQLRVMLFAVDVFSLTDRMPLVVFGLINDRFPTSNVYF